MFLVKKKFKENKDKSSSYFHFSIQNINYSYINCLTQKVSKEESTHPPTHGQSLMQKVEAVDKSIHGVAAFGDGSQVGHQCHIITLLQHIGFLLHLCTVKYIYYLQDMQDD